MQISVSTFGSVEEVGSVAAGVDMESGTVAAGFSVDCPYPDEERKM